MGHLLSPKAEVFKDLGCINLATKNGSTEIIITVKGRFMSPDPRTFFSYLTITAKPPLLIPNQTSGKLSRLSQCAVRKHSRVDSSYHSRRESLCKAVSSCSSDRGIGRLD